MTLGVAGRMLAAGVVTAVAGCSYGGHPPRDTAFDVTGRPGSDWRSVVAPCLDAAWDWKVERSPGGVADTVRISVAHEDYDESRTRSIVACLRTQPGVTKVNKPGFG